MDRAWPLFVYFVLFDKTNMSINDKSVDSVLGTRTRGGRMVGTDESTAPWAAPKKSTFTRVFKCKNLSAYSNITSQACFITHSCLNTNID